MNKTIVALSLLVMGASISSSLSAKCANGMCAKAKARIAKAIVVKAKTTKPCKGGACRLVRSKRK